MMYYNTEMTLLKRIREVCDIMMKHWDYATCYDDLDKNPLIFNFGCNDPMFGYHIPIFDLDYYNSYEAANAMWEYVYEDLFRRS